MSTLLCAPASLFARVPVGSGEKSSACADAGIIARSAATATIIPITRLGVRFMPLRSFSPVASCRRSCRPRSPRNEYMQIPLIRGLIVRLLGARLRLDRIRPAQVGGHLSHADHLRRDTADH